MSAESLQDLLKEFRLLSEDMKNEYEKSRLAMEKTFVHFERILDEQFRRSQENEARAERNLPTLIKELRCQQCRASKFFHHEDTELK